MKRIIKTAFYPFNNKKVELPHCHIKAYVDSCCHEFGEIDEETKLMHLLYVTDKGYKVVKKIKEFLKSHPYVSEDTIKGTLAEFIVNLRYPGKDEYSAVDKIFTSEYIGKSWNLEDLYNILMIEIKKNISYTEDNGYVEFY